MILTASSQTIEFSFDNTSSNEYTFVSSYNDFIDSSDGLFNYFNIVENNGSNTTGTTLVPAISGSIKYRQVVEFFIKNNFTSSSTITIYLLDGSSSYNLFKAVLDPNFIVSYNINNGWSVYNDVGLLETSTTHIQPSYSIKPADFNPVSTPGSNTVKVNASYGLYIGKALGNLSSIKIVYIVAVSPGVATFSEIAVYKADLGLSVGSTRHLTRLGYTDCSSVWNTTGNKSTTVNLTNCIKGDDLYVVFSCNASVAAEFRSIGNITDSQSSYFYWQTPPTTSGGNYVPSSSFFLSGGASYNAVMLVSCQQVI